MKNIEYNLELLLKSLYGKEINNASVKELYNATAKLIMNEVEPNWNKTKASLNKRCGYLSAEFLVGRLIYANMLNMKMINDVKKLFAKYDIDFNSFEEVEDAALGNGGLGRLAACFLESAASTDVMLDGYGIRYRFGLFKQSFVNGFQNEEADDWLKWGDPFSVRKEDESVIVEYADMKVLAVPYDMPVIGYESEIVNTLRLFQSEPIEEFDFKLFDSMNGEIKAAENNKSYEITQVLYPNDNEEKGKILRLRQEYFMVSAALQDTIRKYLKLGIDLKELYRYQIFQLNDTHPVLAIPEFIRLLMREGISFEDSFDTANKIFNFTNHTILGEALERWPISYLKKIIPNVLEIIILIDKKLKSELDGVTYYVIKNEVAYMAPLAIYGSSHVNGVAELHTNILKENTFKEWYEIYPEKFVNVTNGVTPRRWLALNNPSLSQEITNRIGEDWIKHLDKLSLMKKYVDDNDFINALIETKKINKKKLSEYIYKEENILIPTNFMFDIQIKRLHEYKRQLLNAFSILSIYNGLKAKTIKNFKPTAFIFGAKSAPGYYMAKGIIKFINSIAEKINNDDEVNNIIKVVFVHNYNVSYAEKLVCAADLSEQISMAGMEASGTGNMKFMINATPTIGTLDGANVEIVEKAGIENNYIFGATVDEVKEIKQNYNPRKILEENVELKKVVDSLVDGTFDDGGTKVFEQIYSSLLEGDNPDYYLVLADFDSYIKAKLKANNEFDTRIFYKKCAMNMQASGMFSSDRSINDYNKKIWNLN